MIKVSRESVARKVAGAIAAEIRANQNVEVRAVGAGAVNQAVKAVAIARGYVAPEGLDLVTVPCFVELPAAETHVPEGADSCTAIVFRVFSR